MPSLLRQVPKKWIWVAVAIVLAAAFTARAAQNVRRIDFRNSNFVFFWLAGRMVLAGQDPYDSQAWLDQHDQNGVSWQPNPVFPYPLPLVFFLAPLGLLPIGAAYIAWQLLLLMAMAAGSWFALRASAGPNHPWLFLTLTLSLLFYGPAYLALQLGALSAFTLAALLASIIALERERAFLAGLCLSLVLLKPPLAVPMLILGGVWFMYRRTWPALYGVAAGALVLLLSGFVLHPSWPAAFLQAGAGPLTRNLGLQPTVLSLSLHACPPTGPCPWILGTLASVGLGALSLAYLWRSREAADHWAAFSLILPIAFITSVYAWSYDQVPLVLPLAWSVGALSRARRGRLKALLLGSIAILISLVALTLHAYTGADVLSTANALVVLAGVGAVRLLPQVPLHRA